MKLLFNSPLPTVRVVDFVPTTFVHKLYPKKIDQLNGQIREEARYKADLKNALKAIKEYHILDTLSHEELRYLVMYHKEHGYITELTLGYMPGRRREHLIYY